LTENVHVLDLVVDSYTLHFTACPCTKGG